MTKRKVQVRELENGDFCVDLGSKWFRVRLDRTVEKRWVSKNTSAFSSVKSRPATPAEAEFAIREVLMR